MTVLVFAIYGEPSDDGWERRNGEIIAVDGGEVAGDIPRVVEEDDNVWFKFGDEGGEPTGAVAIKATLEGVSAWIDHVGVGVWITIVVKAEDEDFVFFG